jgi:hypothetical protein
MTTEARRTRARTAGAVAAGALGLLGLTACGTSATRAVVQPTTPAPVSPAPTAVLAPIPARPGLLINQPQPFTEQQVRRLRHLSGVAKVALIGYGQVYLYGDSIPTATVNPATYRSFTPAGTREANAVWTAVTEGKALVSHTVGERDHLPLDATVPAGWATVRIGGLATTVPGVDMVVSATTGQRIGVPFGNGLVVAVEGDPDRATARIREVLGPKPAIRRIAAVGGALGAPAGPLLPSVTVSAPPVVPAVPGAPAAIPPAARHATRPDARPAAPVTPPVGY